MTHSHWLAKVLWSAPAAVVRDFALLEGVAGDVDEMQREELIDRIAPLRPDLPLLADLPERRQWYVSRGETIRYSRVIVEDALVSAQNALNPGARQRSRSAPRTTRGSGAGSRRGDEIIYQ